MSVTTAWALGRSQCRRAAAIRLSPGSPGWRDEVPPPSDPIRPPAFLGPLTTLEQESQQTLTGEPRRSRPRLRSARAAPARGSSCTPLQEARVHVTCIVARRAAQTHAGESRSSVASRASMKRPASPHATPSHGLLLHLRVQKTARIECGSAAS
jgi:hypothetical protein